MRIRFLFLLVLFFRVGLSQGDLSSQKRNLTTVSLSVLQFSGLRFPIVVEQRFSKRFSLAIGAGPTIGKKFLGGFYIDLPNSTDKDRADLERRKIGFHLQAEPRVYFSAKGRDQKYFSFLIRYGYFPTVTLTEPTYLRKRQYYLSYGVREKEGRLLLNYFVGLGLSQVDLRIHRYTKDLDTNEVEEGFYTDQFKLPAIIIGLNLGFDLQRYHGLPAN